MTDHRAASFTLVELLVVIATIAIGKTDQRRSKFHSDGAVKTAGYIAY